MSEAESSIRILLVEDDLVDRMAVHRALQPAFPGVVIADAADLQTGLLLAESERHDCALVDYHLPDGSALDFMRRRGPNAQRLPVVVLTGLDDERVAIEAVKEGAQDYLVKGARDGRSIVRAVRYAIERQRVFELQQRLMHADRLASIGQLAAGVAHEVNNPLTYLLANTGILKDRMWALERAIAKLRGQVANVPQTGEAFFELLVAETDLPATLVESREMLGENLAGLERIRSIIRDLKVFSRAERDDIELVSMNDVINTACNIVYNEIRHRARLVKDLGVAPTVAADRGKLAQLFTNILLNAAQSIEEGAAERNQIRITSRVDGGVIRTVIEDTGGGIGREDLERVFEPFFTTKARDVGTGLGLSLCLEIARFHGGSIELRSELGVGTRVEVTLPVEGALRLTSTNPPRPRNDKPHRRVRVLIIDDEELVCRAYARVLKPHHDVVCIRGGRDALEYLETDASFDVLICDLMMPEVDGLMVYERLLDKQSPLVQRLVFASGGAFTSRVKAFIGNVRNLCLEKPLSRELLLSVVEQVAAASAQPNAQRLEMLGGLESMSGGSHPRSTPMA